MAFDLAKYRMADRLANGELDSILADLSGQGLSLSAIAARLFADHGIEVSPPTVALWIKDLKANAEVAS